jgi:signal transduction histidine kinase
MKLSKFITHHLEDILIEWEAFARTLQPSSGNMSVEELRDHGKQILEQISREIDSEQSAKQQEKKSMGLAPDADNTDTAAGIHGTVRQESGFTMLQLIAEYRAMRACVLKLWMPTIKEITEASSQDMLRFNEAIDQALAESAVTFSEHVTRTRDTFLAILGHDLRSPLATMSMAGAYLTRPEISTEGSARVGTRVMQSAATMTAMVNDLLEYARKQLGGKMPITRRLADMKQICQAAVDDASAAHPECKFEMLTSGELLDDFDSARLQQVFSNLLGNAAQYRGKDRPVTISIEGSHDAVTVKVINHGPVITREALKAIFAPLVQLPSDETGNGRPSTSLGLGLYIAREITEAHGGAIHVESDAASGTIFTVRLPRGGGAR